MKHSYSIKYCTTAALSLTLLLSACAKDKKKNSTMNAGTLVTEGPSAGDATSAEDVSPAATKADIDAIDEAIKKDQMLGQLSAGADLIKDRAQLIEISYNQGLKAQIDGMDGIIDAVQGMRDDQQKTYNLLQAIKAQEASDLINYLDLLATSRETERLDLFTQILQVENGLKDAIFFEGVGVVKQWDEVYFAKADTVRDLSVMSELKNVYDDLKAANAKLLVSDHALVARLIEQYFSLNTSLVKANAPLRSSRILKRLLDASQEIADPVRTTSTEAAATLQGEIIALQTALKMPLDAIDTSYMTKLIARETASITAAKTIDALKAASLTVAGFQKSQYQVYAEFSAAVAGITGDALALKGIVGTLGPNSAILARALPGVIVKLATLVASYGGIADGFKTLPDDVKAGTFPNGGAQKISDAEATLKADLRSTALAVKSMLAIAQSKSLCGVSQGQQQGPIKVNKVTCGKDEFQIFTL